jgi:hypothetical protein
MATAIEATARHAGRGGYLVEDLAIDGAHAASCNSESTLQGERFQPIVDSTTMNLPGHAKVHQPDQK